MNDKKTDLYNWARFYKPRVYSRSQKITSDDDVQSWIKKVEAASDKAAADTFGSEYRGSKAGSAAVKITVDNLHDHDSALSEAQELLQQWMQEKVHDDQNVLRGSWEDAEAPDWSERRKTKADIRREWDHLVEQTEIDYGIISSARSTHRSDKSSSSYYSWLEKDSDEVVSEIMSNMMEKEVIKSKHLHDLDLNTKVKDPRTKMKLRHEQVKLNREKRLKELEKRQQEKQSKKEAQFQARQIIKQEEHKKQQQEKQEEEAIQREMAKIRKQLAEEKKLREQMALQEKQEQEVMVARIQEEQETQVTMAMRQEWKDRQREAQRQLKIKAKMTEMAALQTRNNLQLQQRCFTAWFGLVAQSRLQLGKAKALADWRVMMKTFNAWHSYTRSQRLSAEALQHQQELLQGHRKMLTAVNHHKHCLMRKCFVAWQIYIVQNQHQRELEQQEVNNRSKMTAFLQAAASKVWEGQRGGASEVGGAKSSCSEPSIGQNSANRQKVEELFQQAPRTQSQQSQSARSDVTSASTFRSARSRSSDCSKVTKPTDAVQVKREHLKLTNREIATLTGVTSGRMENTPDGSIVHDSEGSTRRPWDKRFVASNMEHRHKAQQKILENQQKQITEQQRLIDELQYLQRQQLLQQQLTNQQLMQHVLNNKNGDGDVLKTFTPEHLNEHITKLQEELVHMKAQVRGQGDEVRGQGHGKGQPPAVKNAWIDSARSDATSVTNITQQNETSRSASINGTSRTTYRTNKPMTIDTARTNITDRTDVTSRTDATTKSSKVSLPSSARHQAFVKSMEERAAERLRIKKEREEKKRQEEEEKLARLLAEQEEQKQRDEEEKRQKMEAYREKKRLEKQKDAEKQAAIERLQHQLQQAADHYDLAVMKYRGWLPWRRLVAKARYKQAAAEQHYNLVLLRKCVISWHKTVAEDLREKRSLADEFHNYNITRHCFANWKMFRHSALILEQKAERWYNSRLLSRVLRTWWDYAESEKIAMRQKERLSREHNLMRIKKRTFRAWREFPEVRRREEEKEKRREELRKKVSYLLPDYEAPAPPAHSSIDSSVDAMFKL